MYKARRKPCAQSGKETLSMYSFLLISMIMCICICMLIQGIVLLFDSDKYQWTAEVPCSFPLFFLATARTPDPAKDPAPARSWVDCPARRSPANQTDKVHLLPIPVRNL